MGTLHTPEYKHIIVGKKCPNFSPVAAVITTDVGQQDFVHFDEFALVMCLVSDADAAAMVLFG